MKLEELKVEDEVCYVENGFHNHKYIFKITKVTKTMITCNNTRFNRETGREVGSQGWNVIEIKILTDELRKEIHKSGLLRFVRNYTPENLSFNALKKIHDIIMEDDKRTR